MRVLETVEVALDWADLDNLTYHEHPHAIRTTTPGIEHVSSVLRRIAVGCGKYGADHSPYHGLSGVRP